MEEKMTPWMWSFRGFMAFQGLRGSFSSLRACLVYFICHLAATPERTSTKPSSQILGQLLNYIPDHNKEAQKQRSVPPSPEPDEWSKIAALPQESFHEFSSSQGSKDGFFRSLESSSVINKGRFTDKSANHDI